MTWVISELLMEHLPFFSPLRAVGNLDPAATQFEHCSSIKSLQGERKMQQKNVTSVELMLTATATKTG